MDAIRNDVRHLKIGSRCKVAQAFTDYDGAVHPVGETWRFAGAAFLPYEDGYTFYVSVDGIHETKFRMQDWPETQGHFFANVDTYIWTVPTEPPPVAPATTISPVATAVPLVARSTAADAARAIPTAAAPPPPDGEYATAATLFAPARSSLSNSLERRVVAQVKHKAGARRLRPSTPMWAIVAGLLIGVLAVLEGLRAYARSEDILFGRYGSYNFYPWWSAAIAGAVMIVGAIIELVRKLRRRRGP